MRTLSAQMAAIHSPPSAPSSGAQGIPAALQRLQDLPRRPAPPPRLPTPPEGLWRPPAARRLAVIDGSMQWSTVGKCGQCLSTNGGTIVFGGGKQLWTSVDSVDNICAAAAICVHPAA